MIWLGLAAFFSLIGLGCLVLMVRWPQFGFGSRVEYAGLVIACIFLGAQTFNAFLHAR